MQTLKKEPEGQLAIAKIKSFILWPCLSLLAIILFGTSFVHANDLPEIFNIESRERFTDLQIAINAANPGDTLVLKGKAIGNFIISKDLSLIGRSDAILDGGGVGTVLYVTTPFDTSPSIRVVLEKLTIRNGVASVMGGGGILNVNADLVILNSEIINNIAPFANGGGILNATILIPADVAPLTAILTLVNTEVKENQTGMSGGGIANVGGFVNIRNESEINSNIANRSGGGIFNFTGHLSVTESEIAHNAAVLQGGGIENLGGSITTLVDVEMISNTARQAGGIFNGSGGIAPSMITISDSKLKGNNTPSFGGGLFNASGSTAIFISTEVTKNGAAVGGGIFNEFGGILQLNDAEVVKNIPENIVDLNSI